MRRMALPPQPWPTGLCERLEPLVRRVLAPNGSPFTYTGTQTYLVGGDDGLAVIDPGPDLPDHLAALEAAIGPATVLAICCTHTHRDHSPAAAPLAARTGAPVAGCAPLALDSAEPRADVPFDAGYAPDRVLADGDAISGPGWTLTAVATPGHTSNHLCFALDPGSIQDITEKTWAVFLATRFDTELGGKPFHLTAGVRRESTDVSSSGVGRLPVALTVNPADPTLLTTTFSETQPITTDSDYSYLLPSLDAKLELTDELHLRFDASRTLTRPAINFLSPVLNVGSLPRVGALTATGGNPALKPYLSDNLDLAVEWYYAQNAYFSVNAFLKDVSGFIVQGTQRQTINDVIDPTTGLPAIYTVSQRVNGPDATVNGWEIAWQHVFGDSGFGFNANATFVDTDKPYDRTDISQSGFAVTGLADSANLVAFFDKYGFEARVAANWRDEYLLQFGQNQNNSAFGAEPTFVNSSLQIDFSTSYQFNEKFNVYFEALNVTNETLSTHGRFDNQLLDVFAYGRRYALGARVRL